MENAFLCFCSFCRVAWNWPLITGIRLFQIHWLLSVRDIRHSLLPIDDAARCFIQTWHAWTNQIWPRSFRWMTAHLVWLKGSQRENYVNWNLRPLLVFAMFQRFFSPLALSPTQFTTFFLDGRSYFFFLSVNKVDLTCR